MKVFGQLESAQLEQIASTGPTLAPTGRVYADVTSPLAAVPMFYNGSAWKKLAFTDALYPTAVKTTNYTAAIGDFVLCNTSGGAFNVTLPTAVGVKGLTVEVIKVNAENTALTILPNGAETLNGAASITLRRQYFKMAFTSDGANWIMGQIAPVTCSARTALSSTQTFTTGVEAVVHWDTNQYESDSGSLDVVTNHSFTVPAGKGGQYLVASCLRFAATSASTDYTIQLKVNGTVQKVIDPKINSGLAQAPTLNLITTLTLVAGDVVIVTATQNSGGDLAMGGITENYLSVTRVAD